MSDRVTDHGHTIEGDLVRKLYQIADLWPEMLLPPATRTGSRPGGVLISDGDDWDDGLTAFESDAQPAEDMPRVINILDARRGITRVLRGWCQVIVEDHNVHYGIPSGTDVPGMVTFLLRWRTQVAEHEAADVILDEVRDCAHLVRRHARPSRPTTMSLGPCPLVHQDPATADDMPCTGTVRTDEGDPDTSSWATCTGCGTKAVATWWEEQMFGGLDRGDYHDRTVTSAEIVTLAHRQYGKSITAQAVWQWTHRKTLSPVDADSRPLRYRLEDVVMVLARKVG